jgi:SPP1 gp7 family putative phage head morphogenesis protein
MTLRKKLNEQRKRLLGRERAVILEMKNQYGAAWVAIKRDLDHLALQIQAAKKAGEPINAAWLLKQRRLESVERTAAAEMRVLVDLLDKTITDAQMTAAFEGRMDAAELIRESMGVGPGGGMFDPVIPRLVPEELIRRVAAGSPLLRRLEALGADAVQEVKQGLLRGLLLGKNPREVARGIAAALNGNRWRANVIARTEMLGVYREAAAASYKANDVVTGWTWLSARNTRTCGVCWSKDGSVHKDSETLASHPCCRCSMQPRTKTWEELGFHGIPETSPPITRGADVFARLSPADQRKILGPGKFDLYKSGKLKLSDLPVKTRSDFGPGLRTKSLKELVS